MKKAKKAGSNMNLVPRNIVILFDERFTQEFIHLSTQLNKQVPSDIVLNMTDQLPHMTIYTTNFPEKNEEKVIQKLQEITKNMHAFPVVFSHPVVDMLGVWINADLTPELKSVHNTIVESLNDLREGLYDEKELAAIGDNEERKQSLLTYGMWAAKDIYVPHVTLSRPKDPSRLAEALQLLPQHMHVGTMIKEIAYVERGPHGTCKKILKRFPLQD